MDPAPPEILLIGLGEVGASIGLAIRDSGAGAARVGFDPDGRLARQAMESGAVEHLKGLPGAARGADLIVLSLPASEVPDVLGTLAPALKPDAVVFDTALSQTASAQAARSLLPQGRHYVGAVPSLSAACLTAADSAPSADLFRGGQIALVFPTGTPETVARLAFQFAQILGCVPFFVDADELDGVAASSEAGPYLVAAALWSAALRAPNWPEAERLAGRALSLGAAPLAWQEPKTQAADLSANRSNVLAKLDLIIEAIGELRAQIAGSEDRALIESLTTARQTYEAWLGKRARGDWQTPEKSRVPMESGGSLLSRLFLPRVRGRGP
ncbi:MAG: prephenate dehydrogenase/arogenate dehydrogenase family protein [Anaerolineales bacterium]